VNNVIPAYCITVCAFCIVIYHAALPICIERVTGRQSNVANEAKILKYYFEFYLN